MKLLILLTALTLSGCSHLSAEEIERGDCKYFCHGRWTGNDWECFEKCMESDYFLNH